MSNKEVHTAGKEDGAAMKSQQPAGLAPIDHLEDRVNALLESLLQSTERRDRALQEVRQRMSEDGALHQQLHRVTLLQRQTLPSYVERAAALARTMQGSAALAAKASHEVRQLRLVLQRAQAVKTLVDSMQTMERHVTEVPQALAANDLERAVKLLRSYEAAQDVLSQSGAARMAGEEGATQGNAGPAGTQEASHIVVEEAAGDGGETERSASHKESARRLSEASALVRRARAETRDRLRQLASDAARGNDKAALQNATRLLAAMGLGEEGRRLYCDWICARTEQTLHKAVEMELRRMNDPTTAAMSHLALVSQILDTVVATYEAETAFMQEHFGEDGPLELLRALHGRSTEQCVPVLKDFLAKRADVLQELLSPTRAGRQARSASSPHLSPRAERKERAENTEEEEEDRAGNAIENNKRGNIAKRASRNETDKASSVTSLAATARRIDRILEESMHLVSCCQLYLSFLQEREAQHRQHARKEEAAKQPATTATATTTTREEGKEENEAADHVWLAQDNALLTSVQELLGLYVPLQERYLELAFRQAVLLQKAQARRRRQQQQQQLTIGSNNKSKEGNVKNSNNNKAAAGHNTGKGAFSSLYAAATTASPTLPVGSPAALMAGLSSLYAAAAQRVEGAVQRVEDVFSDESEGEERGARAGNASRADSRATHSRSQQHAQRGSERSADDAYDEDEEDDDDDDNNNDEGNGAAEDMALLAQPMTLPDDVFFFLRIALHRAANMKSTQITSAVIMAMTNVIQDRLLPYVQRHMSPAAVSGRGRQGTHGGNFLSAAASPASPSAAVASIGSHGLPLPTAANGAAAASNGAMAQQQQQQLVVAILSAMRAEGVTVRALRWCSAGQQCVDYTAKLTHEIAQLAAAQYKGRDLLRFKELAHDLDIVAKEFAATLEQTIAQHAALCVRHILPAHLARLAALSYEMDEEVFYHYELNDPWVQACVVDCEALLRAVDAVVDAATFDVFLRAAAVAVAKAVREAYLKKAFSTFGALQVDKETRALRSSFLGLAHESSPRQAFAALSLMATLLLCDRPRDAMEELANTALTAQEKKAVLLTRVDFSRDEVLALELE